MEPSTPMMTQYHRVKKEFPHALVFFRLGDFYELFFDDAVVASREALEPRRIAPASLVDHSVVTIGRHLPICGSQAQVDRGGRQGAAGASGGDVSSGTEVLP